MPFNNKISQLTDGSPALGTDQIPVNRGGTNYRVNAGTIAGSSINAIRAADYGVVADVQFISDAKWTSGSNSVTAPSNDANFTSADTGKTCFGVHGGVVEIVGTFTYVSAQSGTVSANANASTSVGGDGIFAWGTDDTAAWVAAQTAFLALPTATLFVLPAGYSLTSKSIMTAVGTQANGQPIYVVGQGKWVSIIVPLPSFDFTTCQPGAASIAQLFFGNVTQNILWLSDFGLNFMTQAFSSHGSRTIYDILTLADNGIAKNLSIVNGPTGIASLVALGLVSDAHVDNITLNGACSGTGIICGQGKAIVSNCYINNPYGDAGSCLGIVSPAVAYGYGNVFTGYGTGVSVTNSSAVYFGYGDNTNLQTLSTGISLSGGGSAHLFGFGENYGLQTPAAASAMLSFLSGSGIVTATGSFLQGGSSGGWINVAGGATGKFFDNGGNIFGGPAVNAGTLNLFGDSNSATGTLLTAGSLVLSAGWGTSNSVSAIAGANSPIQFTIQNGTAATGASPTVTYTFPTPYKQAPLWVTATQVGGTNATGTFVVSSLTATGCVLTFSLTPTANDTEIVQLQVFTQ